MHPPSSGDTWLGLSASPLPVDALYRWAVRPDCGAVVLFSGTARDHTVVDDGTTREGVVALEYEAYETHVVGSLASVADEVRRRWPAAGRIALVHRTGRLAVGDSAVVVAVGAPHRDDAFQAARYAIDALKASAPIWKRETWLDGDASVRSDWGTGATQAVPPATVGAAGADS